MKDRVVRCYYRTRWDRNGERESRRSIELTRAKKYERHQKIFGPCKLLQKVHQRLCVSS